MSLNQQHSIIGLIIISLQGLCFSMVEARA
jgi:hypothetical protein